MVYHFITKMILTSCRRAATICRRPGL